MNIQELIRQSNLIEGIDNPKADKQSMKAWRYMKTLVGLNHHTICKVQKMITETQDTLTHEQRGKYRTVRVQVGGRLCPDPFLIQGMMDNWLMDYKDRQPLINHIHFEKIHPFYDGNGRTGRLLLWWQQERELIPLSQITLENRQEYYGWFK